MGRTWRIGEVADRTGLTRRTLRHYDELGLLIPAGRSGGDYRLYDEVDLLRLLQIQNLKALGLSLPEIAAALADPDLDATTTLRSHLVQLEESIAAQRGLAARLQNLATNTDRSWEDVLAAIAMTQALAHPDPIVRIRAALQPSATSTRDLVDALTGETDPAVREVLMWSLAQQRDAAEAALARLDDPDPDLRCLFVRLLAKLRAPRGGASARAAPHRSRTARGEHRHPGARSAARPVDGAAARGSPRRRARTVARPDRDALGIRRGRARRLV